MTKISRPHATKPLPPVQQPQELPRDTFADSWWNRRTAPVKAQLPFDAPAEFFVSRKQIGVSVGYASLDNAILAIKDLTRGTSKPGAFILEKDGRFFGREGLDVIDDHRDTPYPMDLESGSLQPERAQMFRPTTGKPFAPPVVAVVDGDKVTVF